MLTYFAITPAEVNDITPAKAPPIELGATYVFNLGLLGEARRHGLKRNSPAAVVASRSGTNPTIVANREVWLSQRLARGRRNPCTGVLRGMLVELEAGRTLRLLTNDLDSAPRPSPRSIAPAGRSSCSSAGSSRT